MRTIRLLLFLIASFILLAYHQNENSNVSQDVAPHASKEAMILGVYHFDNPGMDTYNLEVDDYFTKKRQTEIKDVVDALASYKPNKIFVEFLPSQQAKLDSLLTLYINDKLSLETISGGQNEVYQLGFRLAKQLGIKNLIAVDHKGVYLGPYADFIADTLSLKAYQDYDLAYKEQMKQRQQRFTTNTIRDNLIYLNTWQHILDNHNYYNSIAITVKDTSNVMFSYQEMEQDIDEKSYHMRSYDFNNIGVELVAEWYKRNLFIYRNILEHTKDNDRILILFGSGHVRYLKQCLEDHPEFNVINTNDILEHKE